MMRLALSTSLLLVCPLAAQTWTQAMPASNPGGVRHAAAAFDLTAGELVMFGGVKSNFQRSSDTWTYDGTVWTQETPATVPPARSHSAMAYDITRGRTVMFGGANRLSDTWEWDGANWSEVTPASGSPSRRQGHCMAYDAARGVVVMFGGTDNPDFFSPVLRETWEWDGTAWTRVMTANSPANPVFGSMCYDFNRGKIVYYGGEDYGVSDQKTWEYDGTNWTDVSGTVGNGPWGSSLSGIGTTYAPLVYDLNRGVCVIHAGGRPGVGGFFSETWEYDGASWCRVAVNPFPQDMRDPVTNFALWRTGYVMVYDTVRGECVLYGGVTGNFQTFYTETWTYTGPVGPTGGYEQISVLHCQTSAGNIVGNTLVGGGVPTYGQPISFRIDNAPANEPLAFVMGGFTDPGGLDLFPIGMPGCLLHTDAMLSWAAPTNALGVGTTTPFGVPNDPAQGAATIYTQPFVRDPGANGFGAVTGVARKLVVGCP